jgi:hypothetical protein
MQVHVVSKADNQVHVVATLDHSEHERQGLVASNVRVRLLLITLSSNNLSYARGGDLLHWWDKPFSFRPFQVSHFDFMIIGIS